MLTYQGKNWKDFTKVMTLDILRGFIPSFFMLGNLEPEESVMENSVVDQVAVIANKLGWEVGDNIVVEIGGSSVSGIDVGEDYNKKWQSPLGTVKYNKDAFIIISNESRRDLTKSVPFKEGEFKPAHPHNADISKSS